MCDGGGEGQAPASRDAVREHAAFKPSALARAPKKRRQQARKRERESAESREAELRGTKSPRGTAAVTIGDRRSVTADQRREVHRGSLGGRVAAVALGSALDLRPLAKQVTLRIT